MKLAQVIQDDVELLARVTATQAAEGIEMNHVGYKGTAAALTDLLGGQIVGFMGVVSDVGTQHKAGKLRVLATSGAQRSRHLPDIPTFRELGYNIEGGGWYAAYAPAKNG